MKKYNKFPAGEYAKPEKFIRESVLEQISSLETFPMLLEKTVKDLDASQLATKTLPGIWSVAQVINHIADSHMNAFIRVKLTLTEDNPTVKPYKESLWANLVDGPDTDIENSLSIIRGVHKRLSVILKSLDENSFNRTYYHPEYKSNYILWQVVALYAWHGKHHLGYINELKDDRGWQK